MLFSTDKTYPRFSSNSEANASKLLANLEEMHHDKGLYGIYLSHVSKRLINDVL